MKVFDSLDLCLKENPNVAFITNEISEHIPIALRLVKKGLHQPNDLEILKKLCRIFKVTDFFCQCF